MTDSEVGQFRLIRSTSVKKECFKLIEAGFIYNKQRTIADTTHWQCEKKGFCKARLHTRGEAVVKRTGEHLHDSDALGVICLEVKAGVKRRARDTTDTTQQILSDVLLVRSTSDAIATKLPKLDSLKRTIRRERKEGKRIPRKSESLEEIVIPPDYRLPVKKENFLYYDSGSDPSIWSKENTF